MGDRLATINIGRKVGASVKAIVKGYTGAVLLCPFRGEELGHHVTQFRLSRGLPRYQVAS